MILRTDPLTLVVNGTSTATVTADGQLTEVTVPPHPAFVAGRSVVSYGKFEELYPVNIIRETKDGFELSVAKRTKTSFFILPMLGGMRKNWAWDTNLVNAFMGTGERHGQISLLFRFMGTRDFAQFEEMVKAHEAYAGSEDPSGKSVLHHFNLDTEQLYDLDRFIAGQYSKMTAQHKRRILSFHNQGPGSDLESILFLNEERRLWMQTTLGVSIPEGAELHSVPEMAQETYNRNIYRI